MYDADQWPEEIRLQVMLAHKRAQQMTTCVLCGRAGITRGALIPRAARQVTIPVGTKILPYCFCKTCATLPDAEAEQRLFTTVEKGRDKRHAHRDKRHS